MYPRLGASSYPEIFGITDYSRKVEWEWKRMIVKIPKREPRECDNCRCICVLPPVEKIIDKIILGHIKVRLESLTDTKHYGFPSA